MINLVLLCDVCANPVEMEIDTPVRFSSGVASSVIVFDHPKQVTCPACGSALHLTVIGISQFQMRTVKIPEHKRQIVSASRILLG
jgi:hypothetical protein